MSGFTLVELIVTIVLIGALVGVSAIFIVQPFEATQDLQRRAALVDATDQALDRITRDARRALPNSLRTEYPGHVEFIAVRTAGRYRRLPGGGDTDIFVPARPAGTFEVLGGLLNAGSVEANGVAAEDCATGAGDCLSIYNTGQEDFNAYDGGNIAGLRSPTDAGTIDYATDGSGFAAHSPNQRFFIFHDVVSYICEGTELYRYTGYGLRVSQPQSGDGALDDGGKRLVANNVTACEFDFSAGSAARRGLLTINLTLSRDGESVNLLDQAQVPNTP